MRPQWLCDPTPQLWQCGAEEAALGLGAGLPRLPAELSLAVSCPSGAVQLWVRDFGGMV